MASLAQTTACLCSNKNVDTQVLCKKRHSGKSVANFQVSKPTLRAMALLGGQKKQTREKWKAWCSDDGSRGIVPEFLPYPSVEDTVREFYDAFRERRFDKLEQLLLPHCVYHDFVYYGPHEGKQNVINFLRTARDAMDQSIDLVVDHNEETDHLVATVHWHLEWKHNKIPFSNGCRHFKFEKVQGKLLISKITGTEELPVNPSELSLKFLKAVRTLFDRYPPAAEMLLKAYGADLGKHMDMHFDFFNFFGRTKG